MNKHIRLKKQDAIEYFGSQVNISRLLDITQPYVSQWPDEVPEAMAWPLWHISKSQKFRRKGKLKVEVFI